MVGIQIGPRQLELPPNMPVLDSAGSYFTVRDLVPSLQFIRVIEVIAADRPDAVVTQELVRVEHPGQDAAQPILRHQGKTRRRSPLASTRSGNRLASSGWRSANQLHVLG